MKNVKFHGIPQRKYEFRGKIPRLNSAAKTQIPRLGAKFRGPQKTVGPTNKYVLSAYLTRRLKLYLECRSDDEITNDCRPTTEPWTMLSFMRTTIKRILWNLVTSLHSKN